MNPFAVARERARALRASVLGELADEPVASSELIALAANKHRLKVLRVEKTSPRLNKADAVLFKKQSFICVRKDVDEGQRAFLVGHEIGHVELHPEGMASHKVSARDGDVSLTRTSGTQYVEAYGARERAELQANVFSRELLLPRRVAISLRAKGWTTTLLAQRLSLPLELVRQQMLDGLLLPDTPAEADEPLKPLTPEQQEAAYDPGRCVNVVAGPGAGKTSTLIARVRRLIEQGCPPHRILVLTFSNKAAREIVDRLQAARVPNVQNVWSGTFHAFGLEFIRKYHDYFGLPADVQVLDKLAQLEVAAERLDRLGLEYYSPYEDVTVWLDDMFLRVISRCREELVGAQAYAEAVNAMGGAATPQQRDTVRIFTAYEETLKREQVLDFSSLVEKPALALKKDPQVFEGLTKAFDHILVDEYQDVNRATAILLTAFAEHAQMWVVGDPRQAIYRFRGASLRNLTEFSKDFPNATRRRLKKNWRTGVELVRFINHVGQTGPLQDEAPFQQLEGNEHRESFALERASCPDARSMHATLAKRILDSVGQGSRRLRDHMVLGTRNETIAAASALLERSGVPCMHFGGIFERPEVRDLLSLFQLLFERFPAALNRVGSLSAVGMPAEDVQRIQAAVAADKSLEHLRWLKRPPGGISAEGLEALNRLRQVLGPLKWSSTPWEATCRFLLDQPDLLLRGRPLSKTAAEVRDLALWMMAYFGRTHDGHGRRLTLSRLLLRVRRRQRMKDVGPLRELPPEADTIDAVRLMTIHASKGLEAAHVHLLDASDGCFKPFRLGLDSRIPPDLLGPDERERFEQAVESDNLLFVAVSRAEERLTLYEDRSFPFDEIASLRSYMGGVTSLTCQPGTALSTRTNAGPPITTDLDQVMAYVGCPRRYYYREVLQLQGSGDASAGARALGASMDAAKVLARLGTTHHLARIQHLRAAWDRKGLGEPGENWGLWEFAQLKLNRAVELAGGSLVAPAPQMISIGSHRLHVQLDCDVAHESVCVGGLFLTYDAWRNKTEVREVLKDVTAHSPWPNRRPIRLLNLRSETTRDTNPYRTSALLRAMDAMAGGDYPARPEPAKCGSCAYLFICGC